MGGRTLEDARGRALRLWLQEKREFRAGTEGGNKVRSGGLSGLRSSYVLQMLPADVYGGCCG